MTLEMGIFIKRFYSLLRSGSFWVLTVFCNLAVFIPATVFFFIESDINPNINSYLDALWWSFSTVTTVGYGDVTPVTSAGKVLGIFVMIAGTGLFATYTAIFANALMGIEVFKLGRRVKKLDKSVSGIHNEELLLEKQIDKLNDALVRLEKKMNDSSKK